MQETVRLRLCGEFDSADRERLETLLAPAVTAATVILDLSEATYLDSTALSCFFNLKKAMLQNGGGSIHLLGLSPNLRKLFDVTKLDRFFEFSTLDANA